MGSERRLYETGGKGVISKLYFILTIFETGAFIIPNTFNNLHTCI